jgi:hypothetical protein
MGAGVWTKKKVSNADKQKHKSMHVYT